MVLNQLLSFIVYYKFNVVYGTYKLLVCSPPPHHTFITHNLLGIIRWVVNEMSNSSIFTIIPFTVVYIITNTIINTNVYFLYSEKDRERETKRTCLQTSVS